MPIIRVHVLIPGNILYLHVLYQTVIQLYVFSELIILFFSSIFLYISNILMLLFLVHNYLFSYHVFQLSLTKRLVHLVKQFNFSKLGLTPRSDLY